MSETALPLFHALVSAFAEQAGLSVRSDGAQGYLLGSGGREVHLSVEPGSDVAVIAAPLFRDPPVRPPVDLEIVADFNATSIFAGGYCMDVDEASQSLRVRLARSLAAMTPQSLHFLASSLSGRCDDWSEWYLRSYRTRSSL